MLPTLKEALIKSTDGNEVRFQEGEFIGSLPSKRLRIASDEDTEMEAASVIRALKKLDAV